MTADNWQSDNKQYLTIRSKLKPMKLDKNVYVTVKQTA